MMGFRVVHVFDLPGVDCGESVLEPLGATLVKGMWHTEEDIIDRIADADAVVCAGGVQPFNRHVFSTLTRARIVASAGVGYNNTDVDAATEFGIVFTNTPDPSLDEVSGRAVAFMLALNHRLFILDRAVRETQLWCVGDRVSQNKYATPIYRMSDQTLGIVGCGKIGTATAMKARGLGMKVIACDPYALPGVMMSHGVTPVDLNTLLKESDYISLHTPLNDETHHIISWGQFTMMKPTCYFINTSRGGCVDEAALIRALQEGRIAGAGIDVTDPEPIEAGNPLLKMDNIILTGHCAGVSTIADPLLWSSPMTQVVKALKGEWPPYAVNQELKKRWLAKWGNKS
jgi:D-3-phosphoglycerate dehydrogenase / 2-oxoglutarate reductase